MKKKVRRSPSPALLIFDCTGRFYDEKISWRKMQDFIVVSITSHELLILKIHCF